MSLGEPIPENPTVRTGHQRQLGQILINYGIFREHSALRSMIPFMKYVKENYGMQRIVSDSGYDNEENY